MWSIPSPEDPVGCTRGRRGTSARHGQSGGSSSEGFLTRRGLGYSPPLAVERNQAPRETNVLEWFAGTNWIESPERGNGRRDKRHLFFCDASRSQSRDADHKCQGQDANSQFESTTPGHGKACGCRAEFSADRSRWTGLPRGHKRQPRRGIGESGEGAPRVRDARRVSRARGAMRSVKGTLATQGDNDRVQSLAA